MGKVWVHDLPVFLKARGMELELEPGWELRSRRSGGYEEVRAIGTHHTASLSAFENQVGWMWHNPNNDARPIGAMLLGRNGRLRLGAAGATNTQGRGGPIPTSRGIIPLNQGNLYMFSIEAISDGAAPWPTEQIEVYFDLCVNLCEFFELDPMQDIWTHHAYVEPSAPNRKIDPAGPIPDYMQVGHTPRVPWVNHRFNEVVDARSTPPPPPPSPTPTLGASMQIRTLSAPHRIYDSRRDGGHLASGTTTPVDVGAVDILQGAEGVAVNVTAIDALDAGFITVWGTGPVPDASCVNYDGTNVKTVAGFTITSLDWANRFHVFNQGRCHIAIDVVGTLAPLTR